jgi:hypothetical protein
LHDQTTIRRCGASTMQPLESPGELGGHATCAAGASWANTRESNSLPRLRPSMLQCLLSCRSMVMWLYSRSRRQLSLAWGSAIGILAASTRGGTGAHAADGTWAAVAHEQPTVLEGLSVHGTRSVCVSVPLKAIAVYETTC